MKSGVTPALAGAGRSAGVRPNGKAAALRPDAPEAYGKLKKMSNFG